jgi:7,8-dihydropterin-6-yl-methyl-4-(beta-D-ribofuranosyl)aminobenzene 5'-phosphate synthase
MTTRNGEIAVASHHLTRRDLLRAATGLGAVLLGAAGRAAPLQVPVVDKLAITVVVDGSFDLFLRPAESHGVVVQPMRRLADYRRSIHNEWGLSLWLESQAAAAQRVLMLDYGYTPEVLANNLELLGLDPARVNALVISHGHYDHFGGLLGFLDRFRGVLPPGVKLYAGGEDNFCRRVAPAGPGQFTDFGVLDRRELAARRVATVLAEQPVIVEGQAFTTGRIRRTSMERVLPNSWVEFGMHDGVGCDASAYLPAGMAGKTVPDEHIHEHATCFHVKDRGLVVISSCGHVGIVNSVRQAQEVSGIQKVHAIVGGFHLGPAPQDYLRQVVAEIHKLQPDVVIPMHCSGLNFVQEARVQMPDNLLPSTTGCRITFGA